MGIRASRSERAPSSPRASPEQDSPAAPQFFIGTPDPDEFDIATPARSPAPRVRCVRVSDVRENGGINHYVIEAEDGVRWVVERRYRDLRRLKRRVGKVGVRFPSRTLGRCQGKAVQVRQQKLVRWLEAAVERSRNSPDMALVLAQGLAHPRLQRVEPSSPVSTLHIARTEITPAPEDAPEDATGHAREDAVLAAKHPSPPSSPPCTPRDDLAEGRSEHHQYKEDEESEVEDGAQPGEFEVEHEAEILQYLRQVAAEEKAAREVASAEKTARSKAAEGTSLQEQDQRACDERKTTAPASAGAVHAEEDAAREASGQGVLPVRGVEQAGWHADEQVPGSDKEDLESHDEGLLGSSQAASEGCRHEATTTREAGEEATLAERKAGHVETACSENAKGATLESALEVRADVPSAKLDGAQSLDAQICEQETHDSIPQALDDTTRADLVGENALREKHAARNAVDGKMCVGQEADREVSAPREAAFPLLQEKVPLEETTHSTPREMRPHALLPVRVDAERGRASSGSSVTTVDPDNQAPSLGWDAREEDEAQAAAEGAAAIAALAVAVGAEACQRRGEAAFDRGELSVAATRRTKVASASSGSCTQVPRGILSTSAPSLQRGHGAPPSGNRRVAAPARSGAALRPAASAQQVLPPHNMNDALRPSRRGSARMPILAARADPRVLL